MQAHLHITIKSLTPQRGTRACGFFAFQTGAEVYNEIAQLSPKAKQLLGL